MGRTNFSHVGGLPVTPETIAEAEVIIDGLSKATDDLLAGLSDAELNEVMLTVGELIEDSAAAGGVRFIICSLATERLLREANRRGMNFDTTARI